MSPPHVSNRAAGSQTLTDVLRGVLRLPTRADSAADLVALCGGATRTVSCFLRGHDVRYPQICTQGTLTLGPGGITWVRYFEPGAPIEFHDPCTSMSLRRIGLAERKVRAGRRALGSFAAPAFVVVVCETTRGVLECTVPRPDAALVVYALSTVILPHGLLSVERSPGRVEPRITTGTRTRTG
jgi:hypothetical protein